MSGLFAYEISIEFDAPIWELNSKNDLVLITSRDSESLQTNFSLYDLGDQQFIFESIGFEEAWWISAFLFNGEQIVFQTYEDTQDIEQRSVFCYDIAQEEVIWSIEGVKLQQVNDQTLLCISNDSTVGSFYIDVRSGSEVNAQEDESSLDGTIYPISYEEESEHYQMLQKFIERNGLRGITGNIEYLEWENLILIAANFLNADNYLLNLFVYDSEGELLRQFELEKEMKGLALGTFFMVGRALIFVEEKRKLKICSIA